MIRAVLFDLDGTLIDTAPDMGGALNNLLIEENHSPLAPEVIRPLVSRGGLVLVKLGFGDKVDESMIEPLRLRFLQHYRAIIADHSKLFEGFEAVLSELETRQIKWGIVTNKPEWLTIPLLKLLNLDQRVASVICGDSLERRKPDPLPLRVAARNMGINCDQCLYVGDDERDIIAGRAAGMKTLTAAYGYIESNIDYLAWQADAVIDSPRALLEHI